MTRRDAKPALTLVVQFASAQPDVPRERLRRWVRAALAELDRPAARYVVTLRFVDVDEGRGLNRGFRGRDYATNVLTFPYPRDDDVVEADVVVCWPVVESEARAQDKDVVSHCAHLVVHGTLHAAGYDHETPDDADTMEAVERRALKRFRIVDPYA